jgi:hypothetical protein
MENLPVYISILFVLTAFLSLWLFGRATHYSKTFLFVIAAWIVFQSVLGIRGFYSDPAMMTKRFPLLFGPMLVAIIVLFITPKGKAFIDGLDLKALTIFHIIRIPVEIVLLQLFTQHVIPRAMSFEGRNFDILSGISAPIIYYLYFVSKKLSNAGLLIWNIICILLLLNVVSSAILSLPARFQEHGFEQANIALGYFPFLLLPAALVPMALFANLAAFRQLLTKKDEIVK